MFEFYILYLKNLVRSKKARIHFSDAFPLSFWFIRVTAVKIIYSPLNGWSLVHRTCSQDNQIITEPEHQSVMPFHYLRGFVEPRTLTAIHCRENVWMWFLQFNKYVHF